MMDSSVVTLCAQGNAEGCFDLRNRGLDIDNEVTYWPKRKQYRLTTGVRVKMSSLEYEAWLLGHLGDPSLNENFVEQWEREQAALRDYRERKRTDGLTKMMHQGCFRMKWVQGRTVWARLKFSIWKFGVDVAIREYRKYEREEQEIEAQWEAAQELAREKREELMA